MIAMRQWIVTSSFRSPKTVFICVAKKLNYKKKNTAQISKPFWQLNCNRAPEVRHELIVHLNLLAGYRSNWSRSSASSSNIYRFNTHSRSAREFRQISISCRNFNLMFQNYKFFNIYSRYIKNILSRTFLKINCSHDDYREKY